MAHYLNLADWAVIFLYLFGVIIFGLSFGKDQKNTRDYFLGSKNIPWWGVGLSIVATETSALTFIGVPAMAFGVDGLSFIQIIIGYVLARLVLAAIMVPRYFRGEIYSPYQLMGDSFGPGAQRTAGFLFMIAGTLAAGVRVYVTCIPIKLMLDVDILPAILLFVILSLIYTYIGGIKAVIWTDAVQFVLLIGGGIITLVYIPSLIEGGWSGAFKEAAAADKLHWFNPHLSLSLPYSIWMGVIGATVQVMSSHGADQLIVQRVLTCKSEAEGKKALYFSAVIILPMFLLFLLCGTMLWVYYQHHAPAIPLPESQAGFKQTDYIFPIFIISVIPNVLKGLIIVAILSAAMSSVSSTLSALASVSTMDLIKPLTGGRKSEDWYFRFSKYSTIFWAVILILVAYLTRQATSVLNVAFSLNGLTSGAMLGGLLLVLMWKGGRSWPVVAGMLVSLATMIFISKFSWEVVEAGNTVKKTIGWPWYTLIGTTVCISVAALLRQLPIAKARPHE